MSPETRTDRLEAALTRLAEAQARTEERVGRLEQAVERLAEAQARTEERVGRLEQAVERLAEAQARTETTLQALTQQVGRLSDTIGFTLEDLAREVALPYLAQHYQIRIPELARRFFRLDGQEIEVDLYGEGHRDGEPVAVVGEVWSRIHGRDVEGAVRQADRLVPQLPATPVVVLFGFVIHPSARAAAERLGAIVISSSGRG
jgi:predicted nuclease with TOPRIM domain